MAENKQNKAKGAAGGRGTEQRDFNPAGDRRSKRQAAHPKETGKHGKSGEKWHGAAPSTKGISPKNEPSAESVKVGEKIVVTIKRIGINGEGVGYYRKKAVFVHGALPDEVVKAKVTRTEPGYLTGEIIEIEKKSPQRKEPPCPIYYKCGGCQIQHMNYDAQLQAKEEIIRESFQRYTKLETLLIRPILGMDNPWGYRNKAQLQVGREGKDVIA